MSKQFDEFLLKEMQEDDEHDLIFSPTNVEEDNMIDSLAATNSLQENMDMVFPLHEDNDIDPGDKEVDDILNGDELDSTIDSDISEKDIADAEHDDEQIKDGELHV